jgi:hypothetical protein
VRRFGVSKFQGFKVSKFQGFKVKSNSKKQGQEPEQGQERRRLPGRQAAYTFGVGTARAPSVAATVHS